MPNTQNKPPPPSLFGIFLDMMLANRQIGYQNKREIVFERRKFRENISLSLQRHLVTERRFVVLHSIIGLFCSVIF